MRRSFLKGGLAAGLAFAWGGRAPAQTPTRIRFTLDWKYQGVHAWYFHAQERGYFRQEGLDVAIDQGDGSAATVTRIMSGAYDAGFGDVNAVIQQAAAKPGEHPVMVYMIYNRAPFAILHKAGGPIKALKDWASPGLVDADGAFARGVALCPRPVPRIRPSSGAKWSNWSAPGVTRKAWHASSSRPRSPSAPGSLKPTGRRAAGRRPPRPLTSA